MLKGKNHRHLSMVAAGLLAAFCILLSGCPKNDQEEVYYPDTGTKPEKGQDVRPHVPVPSLNEYGWLGKANILLGRETEIADVKKDVEDYYSGYPSFLKVLALITKDRNVGLKDNPAYLTDVFNKYYELMNLDPSDPYLAVQDYDVGVLKNALYLSWKQENEFSPVDNYDDMVTSVNY